MEFYRTALQMLDSQSEESFNVIVKQLLKEFPKAKRWLDWHLHSSRAKHLFPALQSAENPTLCKDTNAQESLGGDFQKTAPKSRLNIFETVEHAYRYACRVRLWVLLFGNQ
jgi:hypothetical protein